MARLTSKQRKVKMSEAKNLYLRDFTYQDIADIIDVTVETIRKWSKDENWEDEKKLHSLSIGSLKQEILETFNSLKKGETPKLTSDQISKLAAAFEKLSDKKKHLAYMYDSFEELSSFIAKKITEAKGKRKQELLEVYKEIRTQMQELTSIKYKEALND